MLFRSMQKAAQIVCRQYGGQLPADYAALRALPGIGDYMVPEETEIREGSPEYTGRLCVIGSKLNEEKLVKLFGVA